MISTGELGKFIVDMMETTSISQTFTPNKKMFSSNENTSVLMKMNIKM